MQKTFASARFVSAPLALVLAAAVVPAFAANGIDPTLKSAMQRDLGLSESQVAQYLRTERIADQQQKALEQQQGRNFAGSWIERNADGSFQFVVASTTFAPQASPAGVEIRQARHSLASLDTAKGQLDSLGQRAQVPQGVYGWHVDVTTNSVVVSVAPGAQRNGIDFVAASGADASTVRFETMASAPRPLATFQCGSEYLSYDGANYWYCSVGFSVTKGTEQGFATAGHCGDAGDKAFYLVSSRTVSQIGAFAASNFPNVDRAWVKVDNSHTLLPSVAGSGSVAVKGSTEAPIGAALCRSGRTTGWKCGVIEAKNASVTYPEGMVNGMTRTNICAEGGDSGGPFITGAGQGQGTLSGGSGSCKGGQAKLAKTYFFPLNATLQAYNLTLKTSP
jgi:streptogrisin C